MASFTLFPSRSRPLVSTISTFLCPILEARTQRICCHRSADQGSAGSSPRIFGSKSSYKRYTDAPAHHKWTHKQSFDLPLLCPGCGAYTQSIEANGPGFYSENRKAVKAYINRHIVQDVALRPDESYFAQVIQCADRSVLAKLGVEDQRSGTGTGLKDDVPDAASTATPMCDRCHSLRHNRSGNSIIHPTIQSIRETISESEHKYNHVYHVLDAADFPLSLIPAVQQRLSLTSPRSLNRRAKTQQFQHGKITDISYIISRSDLLAPKKEQVDSLMPYLVEVLRDALGSYAQKIRLGNVYCVSSARGWWTKTLKEDIWDRGGAGWLLGKVNVGKSKLIENIFPKGRTGDANTTTLHGSAAPFLKPVSERHVHHERVTATSPGLKTRSSPGSSLLPPKQSEEAYPSLPLVSSLPGTTASPIRLSFGNGRGELIDLPGLERGDLEAFVRKDKRQELVMRQRIKPQQLTILPGQSLDIAGLIRITPILPDIIILAYPFVPLVSRIISNKRTATANNHHQFFKNGGIERPGTEEHMLTAGTFPLKWDVTKERTGPLTRKAAVKLSTKDLPFIVLSTDVLIEGCGWIELVAQVRKKDFISSEKANDFFDTRPYPMVEIASPGGKCIGVRRPMGAWLLGSKKPVAARKSAQRPRRSMKGAKKEMKKRSRESIF